MKQLLILGIVLASTHSIGAYQCRTTNQDGTSDRPYCPDARPIRCYADVDFGDGVSRTVFSSTCEAEYYDCFSGGKGAFDPCE